MLTKREKWLIEFVATQMASGLYAGCGEDATARRAAEITVILDAAEGGNDSMYRPPSGDDDTEPKRKPDVTGDMHEAYVLFHTALAEACRTA